MNTGTAVTRPAAAGVFTWPSDSPRLIASRCNDCGAVAFPRRGSCERCTSTDVAEHLLGRRGTLWTWTVQRFRPKPPFLCDSFEPYGVGYVDIDHEVLVETRLSSIDPEHLRIGVQVELHIVPFATADDGAPLLTYAFAPATDEH